MVTRKTFKAIADVVASIEDHRTRWAVTSKLVAILRATNPRFDSEKFRAACNPEGAAQ